MLEIFKTYTYITNILSSIWPKVCDSVF